MLPQTTVQGLSVGVIVHLTAGIQEDNMSNVSIGRDEGRDIHQGRREPRHPISCRLSSR